VLTEGAPGALAALERSALDNDFSVGSSGSGDSGEGSGRGGGNGGGGSGQAGGGRGGDCGEGSGCEVRAAFLDWRDDQAALDGPGGGEDDGVSSRTQGVTSGSDINEPAEEGGNWVHKLEGGGQAAAALPRLTPVEIDG